MSDTEIVLRSARAGEGQILYDVTERSVRELAKRHYRSEQLAGWMRGRDASQYEEMIERGNTVVAESRGELLGFVDSEPGEVTRLFLVPQAAGLGVGARLLQIGIRNASKGHSGPIRVESTLNAQGFYAHHGFSAVGHGHFSHGIGGEAIDVVVMEHPSQGSGRSPAEQGALK